MARGRVVGSVVMFCLVVAMLVGHSLALPKNFPECYDDCYKSCEIGSFGDKNSIFSCAGLCHATCQEFIFNKKCFLFWCWKWWWKFVLFLVLTINIISVPSYKELIRSHSLPRTSIITLPLQMNKTRWIVIFAWFWNYIFVLLNQQKLSQKHCSSIR